MQEEDKHLIQRAYRKLLRSIKSKMDNIDRENIRKAYEVAVEAHKSQRRKSGEPFILHPIAVATICADEIGLGPTAIICALLHDVVEDTEITLKELQELFGERIADIVDGLTKLDSAYDIESPQAENFKKVISTLVKDVRVVLIKMADRLHNLRTIGSMPPVKQQKIAAETTYIYAPLAHRLGLHVIKTEFLDLCLKITEADSFFDIANKLQASKRERTLYINEFIKPLTKNLDEIGVPYRITGRPKSIHSVWNKIRTKRVPFEEIYDLFAIRIIVDVPIQKEKPVCWQVYSIVTDVHRPIPERLKDWITTPKSNGYESLHTTVIGPNGRFVEVQIRSERMDEIAERGFAAHWKYKGVMNQPDVYENWLDSVREILENPVDAFEFIRDFKTNLFSEEVYVYTPNGDLRILPKGATALDFAFSIHSDVGYQCKSVKVNKKLVPLGTELHNGDQVHVITNKNQKPNESWLKFVITGKARSKIRSAMKEERRKLGSLGREALERKLGHLKVDFEDSVEKIVRLYKLKSHVELYYLIYIEELVINDILKNFEVSGNKLEIKETEKPQEEQKKEEEKPAKGKRRGKEEEKPGLLINGDPADQYQFAFATCCNPVPGDNVFAYLTSNAGLKIHRYTCSNSTHLMANYGYRVMKAEWTGIAVKSFVTEIKVTGLDEHGVVKNISNVLSSKLNINIRGINISSENGYFTGFISMLVGNKDQLNAAIRTLQNLENVTSVTRVDHGDKN
ncbi:MAG: bifunctional (p)ppGpp synthetase/guanosine-3',5'-bis(diphosphate) 3'-pyrophosphohydrolase [Bacteroidetes bacterium]|nr:bifunctional (p)ppGpp synthetase/guanosine-3',5'-bis(diphosphate) 3'-pyrophosphohydrolase [Bacteroidota bacterium]